MRIFTTFGALVIAAIALSGCAGMTNVAPGPLNGFGRDPLSKEFVACATGHCSPEQQTLAGIAAGINGEQIEGQISSPGESVAVGAVTYGAGYAAGGSTEALFYRGASAGGAAGLEGVVGGIGGAINDAHAWSYADDAGNGTGTERTLEIWTKGIGIPDAVSQHFGGAARVQALASTMYIVVAYVRTNNRTNDEAKQVLRQFHGPKAGAPVPER